MLQIIVSIFSYNLCHTLKLNFLFFLLNLLSYRKRLFEIKNYVKVEEFIKWTVVV